MTREKAIEILENGAWWDLLIPITAIEGRKSDIELHEALDIAIAALRNGWISVNDRLPEEGDGTVLVCFPDIEPYNLKEHFVNAKHDTRVKTAVYSEYSGTWIIGDMGGVSNIQPTHWRPLPEPPEEE